VAVVVAVVTVTDDVDGDVLEVVGGWLVVVVGLVGGAVVGAGGHGGVGVVNGVEGVVDSVIVVGTVSVLVVVLDDVGAVSVLVVELADVGAVSVLVVELADVGAVSVLAVTLVEDDTAVVAMSWQDALAVLPEPSHAIGYFVLQASIQLDPSHDGTFAVPSDIGSQLVLSQHIHEH